MKRYFILLITLFVLVISTKAKTNYWDGNVYDVGTYSTSFNFSETYDANVLGVGLNKEVFFGFRINKEMRMTFSTRGSVVPDTYFLLYDAARSNIIAQSDGVEGDDQAYLECKLSPGQYYMSVTKYGTSQGSITMSIQGKYNNPASNVNAGYYTDEFTYSDTKNTFNYGDSYGLSTSDVTYYFTTTKTFDIDITARFTTGSQKARGYLLNSSGNVLYTGSNGYIYYEKLPPGTYTVIVEGNETDGEIVTQIVGTFPVPGNYYDLGNYEHSFTLTEKEYMDGYDDIIGNELGDVIHKLTLDVPMVVYISHENSNEQHTAIHLWNSELNEIGNNISNPSDIPGSNPNQHPLKCLCRQEYIILYRNLWKHILAIVTGL